jgi:hypothetical protein
MTLQDAFDKWWNEHYDGLDGLDDQDKAWIAVQFFTKHNGDIKAMTDENLWMLTVNDYPISRFKDGAWEFVEEVRGSLFDAHDVAGRLQGENPEYAYRIWDCR